MPLTLYAQGRGIWFPFDRKLGWPRIRSGPFEEKNNILLPGIEPMPSSSQPITILTELKHTYEILFIQSHKSDEAYMNTVIYFLFFHDFTLCHTLWNPSSGSCFPVLSLNMYMQIPDNGTCHPSVKNNFFLGGPLH